MTKAIALRRQGILVRTAIGIGLALTFPFALLAGVVYLVGLSARLAWSRSRSEERPNQTPCGALCTHAHWKESEYTVGSWRCTANRGLKVDPSRAIFGVKSDPNNCTMWRSKSTSTDVPKI